MPQGECPQNQKIEFNKNIKVTNKMWFPRKPNKGYIMYETKVYQWIQSLYNETMIKDKSYTRLEGGWNKELPRTMSITSLLNAKAWKNSEWMSNNIIQ